MRLLGDKISSTIVASTAGVPIVPWSGSEVKCGDGYEISDELYSKACVHSIEEAIESAIKVGYPLMIKASAGGGGKGIRKVNNLEELKLGYVQVKNEVPGSPIFLMKLGVDCRHLEVQVIADEDGNAISLYSRDCSIQRRHQKIIEEGPVVGAPRELVAEMERNAVNLCKAVGYLNAGTVEFLYTGGKYYFLELNPRLQVEHPVTEWITNINIPATQLQIAMGIPLYRIPDIRQFYNHEEFGTEKIDFTKAKQKDPNGHVIAVRITAENVEEGFQPTSGSVIELNFQNSPDVWGYFSIRSTSGIHQFSDSQFGHIFAHGINREEARKKMIMTLNELSIRGDIRETSQYIRALLKLENYVKNEITTSYLDGLIANKFQTEKPDRFLAIICGAVHSVYSKWKQNQENFIKSFQRGQIPSVDLLTVQFSIELIYDNSKYVMETTCSGVNKFTFSMNGSYKEAEIKEMRDEGLLILIDGESHVTYSSQDPNGIRLTVDGVPCLFTKEFDPSTIRANTSGKFVRFLVEDGSRITAKQPIAEIEMMKMIITLYAPLSGKIKSQLSPGTALKQGDIIALLDLDDPSQIKRAEVFEGKFPEQTKKINLKPYQTMQYGVAEIQTLLAGYDYPGTLYDKKLNEAVASIKQVADPSILKALFIEKFSPLKVHIPLEKHDKVNSIIENSKLIMDIIVELKKLVDKDTEPLFKELFTTFEQGPKKYALDLLSSFASQYINVESIYSTNKQEEYVFFYLRDLHKNNYLSCFEIALSHRNLKKKNKVLLSLLKEVEAFGLVNDFLKILESLSSFSQPSYASVSLVAKHMIMKSQMPSFERMRKEMEEIFKNAVKDKENRNTILKQVIETSNFSFDTLMTFFSHEDSEIRSIAAEVYVKKAYTTFDNKSLKYNELEKFNSITWKFVKIHDSEATNLKEGIVGSVSSENLVDETEDYTGFGVMVIFNNLQDLQVYLPSVLSLYESSDNDNDSINILNICLKWREKEVPNDEEFITIFSKVIDTYSKIIQPYDIRRITILVDRKDQFPHYFTFRQRNGYKEDPIYRHIEPTLAFQLYLRRMSNYNITPFPIDNPSIHIYYAKPKKSDRSDALQKRFFVRVLVLKGDIFNPQNPNEFQIAELERLFVDALNALALAMSDSRYEKTYANHILINLLPEVIYKQDHIEELFTKLQLNHSQRLKELRVSEAEARVRIRFEKNQPPMGLRFVCSNITGYHLNVHFYKETQNQQTGKMFYSTLFGKQNPLHGQDLNSPHPLLTIAEQKREIAHDYETSYVYDYPDMFDLTLKQVWKVWNRQRGIKKEMGELLKCQELGLNKVGELTPLEKSDIGKNNYGIVVWKMTLNTPEYPNGRDIIVIANDITYQSGSFSVLEDQIFYKASELARKLKIPRVFINANSGARIGLAKEVQKAFKIAWNNQDDVTKGSKYLYISDQDYPKLKNSINAEEIIENGEKRWKIIDIIGQEDGIGVENLKGSGLIAGETSRSYKEIFTINYVASRTVGIGAYLVRLGQRVIQHKEVPIILTGSAAINKVLGRDVYTSNRQLGGTQIMYTNGVSHLTVPDDFKGILSILRWLSYIPCKNGSPLPIIKSIDSIDREIEWSPSKDQSYDPRNFIAGVKKNDQWISGFFDKDSFIETLGGWALTVVTGRARLGGIPIGVISVETRTIEQIIPADPADTTSQEQILQKAGQVWYPDSAYKTAQAIKDFSNGEELPLIIFANWRGFSGGQRDMFNEILKFGSYIVDELREYKKPVFIYIPPFGELRGGAWVVVDPTINPEMMEMYADINSRGGILEPSGTVEIKFRKDELLSTIRRLDHIIIDLNKKLESITNNEEKELIKKQIIKREQILLPVYLNIAESFCGLQDTPGRMKAKDTIREVLEWKKSRTYFYWRLRRRLLENEIISRIQSNNLNFFDKQKILKQWINEDIKQDIWNHDQKVIEWFEKSENLIQKNLEKLEKEKIEKIVLESFSKDFDSSMEGLFKFIQSSGKKDEILKLLQK